MHRKWHLTFTHEIKLESKFILNSRDKSRDKLIRVDIEIV